MRRHVSAVLTRAAPVRLAARDETETETVGVALRYQPTRSRIIVDPIDDFADLGPAYCIPSVGGLGKILRILRAARIAPPEEPAVLLGRETYTAELLSRAIGTDLLLELLPRSTVRFVAWTEDGVETVDGVKDVLETSDAFVVLRNSGLPVRLPRASVVRQRREALRTFEVVGIG